MFSSMGFRRRLFFTITLLIVTIMSANFVVSTMSAREYFSAQLSVLAEDAATSLAFSISHAAKEEDTAQIETMIGAVFDSGYYLSINYLDLDRNVILSRTREVAIEKVPDWFVSLVNVPLSSGSAEVQSGWYRIGEVRVVAHPGYVIRELWRAIIDLAWVYCFFLVLSYGLLGLLLNYLTRPLVGLEKQADAIANEDYVSEAVLPKGPEFRRLALAMNRLASRIREAFQRQASLTEELRQELCVDSLTKLPNRSEFDSQLISWLESDEGDAPAALCLISLPGLLKINQEFGRDYADALLLDMAAIIKAYSNKHRYSILGRRSGTDFSLFFPGMFAEEAEGFLQSLREEVEAMPSMVCVQDKQLELGGAFTSGRVNCSELFSAADTSLRQNVINSPRLSVTSLGSADMSRSARDWRPVLETAVDKQNFSLVFQSVNGFSSSHFEVFCRIDEDGSLVSAAAFWPLLERFGLHFSMDKLILNRTLDYLNRFPDVCLCVNLTPASAIFGDFVSWLIPRLAEESGDVLRRLTLELRESLFVHYDRLNEILLSPLKIMGVAVGVDRFGFSSEVLSRLQKLELAYVKLDRRFIRSIDERKEDRFYLRTLESICRASDTQIIVEGVERSSQVAVLEELGLLYQQGFYFGLPKNEHEFELGMKP